MRFERGAVPAERAGGALCLEELACPLDRATLTVRTGVARCTACGTAFEAVEVEPGVKVPDFRCLSETQYIQVTFKVPVVSPSATMRVVQPRPHETGSRLPSREEVRRRFGTKLQRSSLRHMAHAAEQYGSEAAVLDLGCGGGGNRRALALFGLTRVTAVDLWSATADFLADAHRLPFRNGTFEMVVATATIEHFANPFLAFREIARVLKPGGIVVGTASFWESWHAESYFHTTPDALSLLCGDAGLELTDLWSGWGFVASVGAHALGLGRHKALLYRAQSLFDGGLRVLRGHEAASEHRLRTSGSFGLRARKPDSLEPVGRSLGQRP